MNRNKRPDMSIPKLSLSFYFDEIALSLDGDQYRDMLDTLEHFESYAIYQKYNRFRPVERTSESLWTFASMWWWWWWWYSDVGYYLLSLADCCCVSSTIDLVQYS
jgi:hypothetical protein